MPIRKISPEFIFSITNAYPNLEKINLSNNDINEIENLGPLKSLRVLDLSGNAIEKINNLDEVAETLQELDLHGNLIASLEGLECLYNLESLNLGCNSISDVSEINCLRFLPQLKSLTLEGNPVASHPGYPQNIRAILPGLQNLDVEEPQLHEPESSRPQNATHSHADKPHQRPGAAPAISAAPVVPDAGAIQSSMMSLSQKEFATMSASARGRVTGDEAHQAAQTNAPEVATFNSAGRVADVSEGGPQAQKIDENERDDLPSHTKELEILQRQLKQAETSLAQERKKTTQYDQTITRMRQETDASVLRVQKEANAELKSKLGEMEKGFEEQLNAVKKELEEAKSRCEKEKQECRNLHAYIADLTQPSKPATENEKKIAELDAENEALKENVELMTITVESVKEVLAIQEKEVAEMCSEQRDLSLPDISAALLNKWRHKVFELIVASKQTELEAKENRAKEVLLAKQHHDQLREARAQVEMLKKMEKGLKAEIRVNEMAAKDAKEQLSRFQQKSVQMQHTLESTASGSDDAMKIMRVLQNEEEKFNKSLQANMEKINAYSSRLNFALGRMNLLRGLWNTREDEWRKNNGSLESRVRELEGESAKHADEYSTKPYASEAETEHLRKEIEKLTVERDFLLKKCSTFDDNQTAKIEAVKAEFNANLKLKEKEIAQLQKEVETKSKEWLEESQKVDALSKQLQSANLTCTSTEKELVQLNAVLDEERRRAKREIHEARSEVANESQQRFASISTDYNDLKREHAKTVVNLRQLERQIARQKDRYETTDKSKFESLENKLHERDQRIQNLLKERNALLHVVREKERESEKEKERGNSLKQDREEREKENESGGIRTKKPQVSSSRSTPREREVANKSVEKKYDISEEYLKRFQRSKGREHSQAPSHESSRLEELERLSATLLSDSLP